MRVAEPTIIPCSATIDSVIEGIRCGSPVVLRRKLVCERHDNGRMARAWRDPEEFDIWTGRKEVTMPDSSANGGQSVTEGEARLEAEIEPRVYATLEAYDRALAEDKALAAQQLATAAGILTDMNRPGNVGGSSP